MNCVLSVHHCSGNLDHQKPLIPEKHSFNSFITFSQNRGRRYLTTHPRDTQNGRKLRTSEPQKLSDMINTNGDDSLCVSLSNSQCEMGNSKWCCSDINGINDNNDQNVSFCQKVIKVYACPQRRSGERVVRL
jgi:hypothetical protein